MSPRLSPSAPVISTTPRKPIKQVPESVPESPEPNLSRETAGEMFAMDDEDMIPTLSLSDTRPRSSRDSGVTSKQQSGAPWKAKSTPTNRVDFKSILAEAEGGLSKPSRPQAMTSRSVVIPPVSLRAAGSRTPAPKDGPRSWAAQQTNTPPHTSSAFPAIGETVSIATTASNGGPQKSSEPQRPKLGSTPSGFNQSQRSVRGASGQNLGPVIIPGRKSSSVETIPRRSTSDAWAVPPPVEPPSWVPSPSDGSLSFADIQVQQQVQSADRGRPRRSLLDIQNEEAANLEEANFMVWWTAEEERLRQEAIEAEAQERRRGSPRSLKTQNSQGSRPRKSAHPEKTRKKKKDAGDASSQNPPSTSSPAPRRRPAQQKVTT